MAPHICTDKTIFYTLANTAKPTIVEELPLTRVIRTLRSSIDLENQHYRYRSMIMRRGEEISQGWNSHKSHPKQALYATNEFRIFLHAEIHAIIRARQSVVGCDLYVFRWLKNGSLTTSSPCNGCMQAMLDAGLSSVTYYKNDHFERIDLG